MTTTHRLTTFLRIFTTGIVACMGLVVVAPSAVALQARPTGGSSGPASSVPVLDHATTAGGMPTWQIVVIVVGVAVVSATIAVAVERVRKAPEHRVVPAS